MELLIILCVAVASPIVARRWLLAPVFCLAGSERPSAQFSVLDLAALCLHFGVAMALLSSIVTPTDVRRFYRPYLPWYLAIVLVYVGATWRLGLTSLNAAGIKRPGARFVYLSVAVPLAYAGAVVSGYVTLATLMMIFTDAPTAILLALAALLCWIVTFASPAIAQSIAAKKPAAAPQPSDENPPASS